MSSETFCSFDKMGVDFRSLIGHSRLSSMWEKSWIEKRGAKDLNMVCRWFNTATQLASFLWRHGHPPCANTTESVRKGGDYRRWPAGMSGTQWEKLVTVLSWERNPRVLSVPDYHDKGPLRRKKKNCRPVRILLRFLPPHTEHIIQVKYTWTDTTKTIHKLWPAR